MTGLSELFNRATDAIPGELGGAAIVGALAFAFGYVAKGIKSRLQNRRANKALDSGHLSGYLAVLGETEYAPLSLDPVTGEQRFSQRIRNYKNDINVLELMHPDVRPQVEKFLQKAMEKCTRENPLVFSHLVDVLDATGLKKAKAMFTTAWVNYFASLLTDVKKIAEQKNAPEEHREQIVYPVLVYEQGAHKKQMRILLIWEQDLDDEDLPPFESIDFQFPHHSDRYYSHRAIISALRDPKNAWIKQELGVAIRIPKPEALPVPGLT